MIFVLCFINVSDFCGIYLYLKSNRELCQKIRTQNSTNDKNHIGIIRSISKQLYLYPNDWTYIEIIIYIEMLKMIWKELLPYPAVSLYQKESSDILNLVTDLELNS